MDPIRGRCSGAFAVRGLCRRIGRGSWQAVLFGVLALSICALTWIAAGTAHSTDGSRLSPVSPGRLAGRPVVSPTPQPVPSAEPPEMSKHAPAIDLPQQPGIVPASWPVLLQETFDDNARSWDVGTVNLNVVTLSRSVANGLYNWDMEARKPLMGWSEPVLGPLTGFYAGVDVRLVRGTDTDVDFGLSIRPPDIDSIYLVLASSAGGVMVERGIDDSSEIVMDWVPVDALRRNDWNRMAIRVTNSRLTVYVNDQVVGEVSVEALAEIQPGVVVRASQPAHPIVQFDNFEIRVAQGNEPPLPTTTREPVFLPSPLPGPATLASTANPITWGRILTGSSRIVPDWPIVFWDTFDDSGNGWSTYEEFNRQLEASKVVEGTLAWQFKALQDVQAVAEVPYSEVTDFYAAVDAKRYSGPEDVWYGFTFRQEDSNHFYSFLVNDRQNYQIQARAGDILHQLVGPVRSEVVRPGAPNRIAVMGEGARLTCFINDQPVIELEIEQEDILFREGTLGLKLDAKAGDVGIMEFDKFELRTPRSE
jgi:uncharacterized protein YbaA (DUF1428 family)